MNIVRAESEQLAILLRQLEQEADKQKHETDDPYWQGKADAFRTIMLYLPSFLYMNEDETFSCSYEKASLIHSALIDSSINHEDIVHDLEAFIDNVDKLRGTFKAVNPFELFRNERKGSE